jgi:hypothetical protein
MRQVRREASKGELIIVTNSFSEHFGKRFVVDYMNNGAAVTKGVGISFKHHEYEVLEVDISARVAAYVHEHEVNYALAELSEAITLNNLDMVIAAKNRLRELNK